MKHSVLYTTVAICAAAVIAASMLTHAGPLDPPAGPVTSSYKTLTDVEPRTAINAANTPGDAGTLFRITTPGSYYLTQNIQMVANKAAIGIAASDVTIDLNGFTITGAANASQAIVGYGGSGRMTIRNGRMQALTFTAIAIAADSVIEDLVVSSVSTNPNDVLIIGDRTTVRRCQVVNGGSLANCGNGCVFENIISTGTATGIQASSKTDITVRNCRISGPSAAAGSGIACGDRLTVRGLQVDKYVFGIQCSTYATIQDVLITGSVIGLAGGHIARISDATISNTSSTAMQVGNNSQVTRITVTSAVGNGIDVEDDCIVTSCTVTGCSTTGIIGTSRNTIVDCSSSKNISGSAGFAFTDSNSFTNCRADENTADGFNARFGNIWQSCTARSNSGDGIESSSGGAVLAGRFDGNGSGASVGANIRITGDACRIDGNSLIGGDFGIQTVGGGNTIHRNSSRNSANSYGGIAGGNDVGPIGSSATATSPWANIQY